MSLSVVRTHGTNGGYVRGCRCEACRKAHREYEAAHRKAKADPDSGYIAADRARAHLLFLAEHGLGVGAVNVATDIIPSIIIGIRNGKRTRLQKRTEKKILAVTPDLAPDQRDAGCRHSRIRHPGRPGQDRSDHSTWPLTGDRPNGRHHRAAARQAFAGRSGQRANFGCPS